MAKSALCIGVVALIAAGAASGSDLRTRVEGSGREAAAALGRACAASKDCVGLEGRIASAAIGQPGIVPGGLAQAAVARVSDAISVPQALNARTADTGHATRRAERHIRRIVAAGD